MTTHIPTTVPLDLAGAISEVYNYVTTVSPESTPRRNLMGAHITSILSRCFEKAAAAVKNTHAYTSGAY
jgi:hypothetical protein